MTTRNDAAVRASALDGKIDGQVNEFVTGPTKELLRRVRAYLIKRADEMNARNNVIANLRISQPDQTGVSTINYGPSIDKGETDHHFYFDSGARLCFGITVRGSNTNCEVLSYRFHYHYSDNGPLEFVRFDLNTKKHPDPLMEPRSHVHPGLEDMRLPLAPLAPLEVLDRVFFVLEPLLSDAV